MKVDPGVMLPLVDWFAAEVKLTVPPPVKIAFSTAPMSLVMPVGPQERLAQFTVLLPGTVPLQGTVLPVETVTSVSAFAPTSNVTVAISVTPVGVP